jgi:hypothetical protein
MANGRAKRGGQVGMNGEQYDGGQFLPSTDAPKGTPAAKSAKMPRKVQVQCGQWIDRPEGAVSIYEAIAGTRAKVDGNAASRTEAGIRYYGAAVTFMARDCGDIDALIARYNAGERWV